MAVHSHDPYKIQVLAQADKCPTDGTCFIAGTVPARPGRVQIVGKTVADPQLRAAYAHKIGPGEDLFELDETEWNGGGRA